jgi:two-component system, OmpR family, response regulator VicR
MSKRILVIDDEKEIIDILKLRLQAKGYEVLEAYDGASGLDLAKSQKPDLIILDIILPLINGFTVCSLLKGNEIYKSIPVIILTAREEDNDQIFDHEVKPDAFMNKPFDAASLLAKIHELLER